MTVFVNIDFNASDNTHATPSNDITPKQYQKTLTMPKKKSKAAQTTAPLISDNETDANTTDAHNPAEAPVTQLSNAELNHLVLQRWCPNLHTILAISPFAVLYNFNPETAAWEKSDIQGSLFVLQLHHPSNIPQYEIMILNRKHPENLHLPITSSENIEATEEFVIVHIEEGEQTVGLWMFSDEETPVENRLESIAGKILECAVLVEGLGGVGEEGMDGFEESQQFVEQPVEREREREATMQGQSIDLATLFAKPVQQQEPPPQQNVLLDLFNNAKRGLRGGME